MALIRLNTLADVPLYYDRDPASNYGTTGFRSRPYADADFAVQMEQAFQHLFQALEAQHVGSVRAVLFGGLARAGNGPSYHHKNRAFDLDGLIFHDRENWVANTFPSQPHIYLAIEGVLRQHFGTVLSYDYDARHRDHFHFDNGDTIGFERYSKSRVLFLQNSARYLFDLALGVDGLYGPETRAAERLIRKELGLGGFSDLSNWMSFLEAAVDIATSRAAQLKSEELVA